MSENKWYALWKMATVHPDLKIDYFHNIDTKEKAYWLGFLYADGTIYRNGTSTRIAIELGRKDEDVIDRFCQSLGLTKERKKYRIHDNTKRVLIGFGCKRITNDLLRHGLKFLKSKTMEYPKLNRRDLELAFLLGYFDGDGKQRTTRLFSGSRRFLEQVSKRFDLQFKAHENRRESRLNGRKIKGTEYYMHLGAKLFNEMMENYENSMPRKRWHPCNPEDKLKKAHEVRSMEQTSQNRLTREAWRSITREELEKLVWQMPLEQISRTYYVSRGGTVADKCDRLRILRPRKNYWQKQSSQTAISQRSQDLEQATELRQRAQRNNIPMH
jgi:hypothetical protein